MGGRSRKAVHPLFSPLHLCGVQLSHLCSPVLTPALLEVSAYLTPEPLPASPLHLWGYLPTSSLCPGQGKLLFSQRYHLRSKLLCLTSGFCPINTKSLFSGKCCLSFPSMLPRAPQRLPSAFSFPSSLSPRELRVCLRRLQSRSRAQPGSTQMRKGTIAKALGLSGMTSCGQPRQASTASLTSQQPLCPMQLPQLMHTD